MRVIESRSVDQRHRGVVAMIEVGEFLDLIGLRLVSVADDDILVTSESVDELKLW